MKRVIKICEQNMKLTCISSASQFRVRKVLRMYQQAWDLNIGKTYYMDNGTRNYVVIVV